MSLNNLFIQVLIYLTVSIVISLCFNFVRKDSISLISKELLKVESVDQLSKESAEPSIKQINLDIAKKLFFEDILFVDARAEEYYSEGHIPNSICHDNIDTLFLKLERKIFFDDAFVVYCSDDHCGSSEELAISLQENGYSNIYVFKGGWKQWSESDLPFSKNE